MRRIILINGVIAGLIVSGILVITHPLVEDGTIGMNSSMFLGYASMVLAFSMVFVGIKTYRDRILQGVITFGQGCKVGLLITLIASVMYAVTWDVYYRVTDSEFLQKYTAHYIEKMETEGASQEEIASMRTEMDAFSRMYENTFIRFCFTLLEIVPVGIAITLLSAAVLRKRAVVSTTQ